MYRNRGFQILLYRVKSNLQISDNGCHPRFPTCLPHLANEHSYQTSRHAEIHPGDTMYPHRLILLGGGGVFLQVDSVKILIMQQDQERWEFIWPNMCMCIVRGTNLYFSEPGGMALQSWNDLLLPIFRVLFSRHHSSIALTNTLNATCPCKV